MAVFDILISLDREYSIIYNSDMENEDPVIREKIKTLISTMLEASQHDN